MNEHDKAAGAEVAVSLLKTKPAIGHSINPVP
jgi:hypothetical protein